MADDPASSEYIGQHVKFYDKRGEPYLGEICWTGRGTPRGQQECNVVGIKTVSLINMYGIGMSYSIGWWD